MYVYSYRQHVWGLYTVVHGFIMLYYAGLALPAEPLAAAHLKLPQKAQPFWFSNNRNLAFTNSSD